MSDPALLEKNQLAVFFLINIFTSIEQRLARINILKLSHVVDSVLSLTKVKFKVNLSIKIWLLNFVDFILLTFFCIAFISSQSFLDGEDHLKEFNSPLFEISLLFLDPLKCDCIFNAEFKFYLYFFIQVLTRLPLMWDCIKITPKTNGFLCWVEACPVLLTLLTEISDIDRSFNFEIALSLLLFYLIYS